MRKRIEWGAIDHGLRTTNRELFSLLFPRKQGRRRPSIFRLQANCLYFQLAIQVRRARAVKIEQGKDAGLSGKGFVDSREGTGASRAVAGGASGMPRARH
jgi:hypothetical protein